MSLLWVNQGKVLEMQALFDKGIVLRLFKGAKIPTRTDVEADYTECDYTGYAAKTLVAEQWVFTEGNPTNAKYPTQEFELTDDLAEDQVLGGYYLTQVGTGKLLGVESFAVPQVVNLAGQGCLVEVNLQLAELV